MPNCPLEILYMDEHCIAINKPAGMLVHRSFLAKHETVFAMQLLRDQIGQHVYPVHRLDRPTSGVLLFALSSEDAHFLTQQFEHKEVEKKYLAVVRGWMGTINGKDSNSGTINYPLKVIKDKIADKYSSLNKPDQSAITDWQVLDTTEQPFSARKQHPTSRYTLLQLSPKTGRKHQLRRHMKHIFHPIIGDTSYGDHHQNRAIRKHFQTSRLMLHAQYLKFTNLQQEPIEIYAPLDDEWFKFASVFKNQTNNNPFVTKY